MDLLGQENIHRMSHQMRSYLGGIRRGKVWVNGQYLRYLEGGKSQSQTIVFVHGMGGNKTQWRSLMDIFSAHYRVIALDMPGLCNGVDSPNGYGFDHLAAGLFDFVEALGLSEFHLFGHSLGANVCLVFAARHPACVRSLSLCSVVVIDNEHETGVGEISRFSEFRQMILFNTLEEFQKLAAMMFYDPPKAPDLLMRYSMNEVIKHRHSYARLLSAFEQSAPIVRRSLDCIRCPTLVIGGEKDVFISEESLRLLRQSIKGAMVIQLPQCAHIPYLEKPKALGHHFNVFLSSLSPQ